MIAVTPKPARLRRSSGRGYSIASGAGRPGFELSAAAETGEASGRAEHPGSLTPLPAGPGARAAYRASVRTGSEAQRDQGFRQVRHPRKPGPKRWSKMVLS
jgi:hypothetical protein